MCFVIYFAYIISPFDYKHFERILIIEERESINFYDDGEIAL